jgi:DNA mismatch repair protein MutL
VRGGLARRSWLGGAPGAERTAPIASAGFAQRGQASRSEPQASEDQQWAERRPSDWLFAGARASADPASPAAGRAVDVRVRFGELRLLGQLLATYLLVEGKQDLLLIDQHAAHERVLYEQLRASWLARGVERQPLLAPLAVQLEPRALAVLAERAEDAARRGFEIEPFGDDTIAVRTVPALLTGRDPAGLVRGLADSWMAGEGASSAAADVRSLDPADRSLATLACHAARRKGDPLDPREQRALLDALDAIPWAPTCPHGRPVVVPFTGTEIERRFGRR